MTNNVTNVLRFFRNRMPVFMNVTVVGLLAGLSFAVQFGLLPVLNHLDVAGYITVMQGITPTFTQAVVPLMAIGSITFLIRLLVLRPPCAGMRYWTAISFLLFLCAGAITIRGHWPINTQVIHWTAGNPPPDWQALRARWGTLNFWRFAVAQLAFIALLAPLIFARNQPTERATAPTGL